MTEPISPAPPGEISGSGNRQPPGPAPSRGQWLRQQSGTIGLLAGLSVVIVLLIAVLMKLQRPAGSGRSAGHAAAPADRAGSPAPRRAGGPPADRTPNILGQLSEASQNLSQHVRRSVVRVDARQVEVTGGSDELSQLFGSRPPRAAWGQGAGVIVDADGYILTNYHVVRSAESISVVLDGHQSLPARLIGADALTDLAVLKIDAHDLAPIEWGDSSRLREGAFVWAIGSPFGLEGSVSLGIISAMNRNGLSDSPFQEFMQTDAAINPGNSGGPLVNSQGRVIGINTAILGEQFQGISFAIPSATARDVYQRLKQHGRVARGWLGIDLDVVTPQRSRQQGAAETLQGAYVVAVPAASEQPSPAQQAGLRPGDILTRWNGQPVDGPVQLARLVAQSPIGSQARLTLLRDGRRQDVEITVGQRP